MSGRIPKRVRQYRPGVTPRVSGNKMGTGTMLSTSVRHKGCVTARSIVPIRQLFMLPQQQPPIEAPQTIHRIYELTQFPELQNSQDLAAAHAELLSYMVNYPYLSQETKEAFQHGENTDYAVISLRQSDFARGTVRITQPGIYTIEEDIVFHPNPENDFQPLPEDVASGLYPIPGGYQLGFFAAIAIEANDVILDLQGHTIEQSKEHFLQQRFYATIELGSSPFIRNQGPSSGITGSYAAPERTAIINGTLGLSSHHGIHGNLMKQTLLHNLTIEEVQVAGIALNGAYDSILCDITIAGTTGALPTSPVSVDINFAYSQARFIRPFLQKLQGEYPDAVISINGTDKTIGDIQTELTTALEEAREAVIDNIGIVPQVFRNDNTLSDGNVYGILLHVAGVAVNGFLSERPEETETTAAGNQNLYLKNVTVNNIASAPKETVAITAYKDVDTDPLGYNNTHIVKGPVGDVFDILFVTDENGHYRENPLANAQVILGKYVNTDPSFNAGTTYFPDDIVTWVEEGTTSIADIIQECPEGDMETTGISGEKLVYKYGLDAMAHVMKGNFGLFFSGSKNVTVHNVDVRTSTVELDAAVEPPNKDATRDLCLIATEQSSELQTAILHDSVFVQ